MSKKSDKIYEQYCDAIAKGDEPAANKFKEKYSSCFKKRKRHSVKEFVAGSTGLRIKRLEFSLLAHFEAPKESKMRSWLCDITGIKRGTLDRIFSNDDYPLNNEIGTKIADALNIDFDWLMYGIGAPPSKWNVQKKHEGKFVLDLDELAILIKALVQPNENNQVIFNIYIDNIFPILEKNAEQFLVSALLFYRYNVIPSLDMETARIWSSFLTYRIHRIHCLSLITKWDGDLAA